MRSSPRLLVQILTLVAIVTATIAQDDDFHLTLLHTTDVSSRFEQFLSSGMNCTESQAEMGKCFGGVARRATAINKVRNERNDINVLLLDAGDQFVGTWFNFFEGEATSYFMNLLGYDVMTFGNLEFAAGLEVLAQFLEDINFPIVSANLNITNVPALQGLFNKSTVIEYEGERIGIIGYGHEQINVIALLGGAEFTDPIPAIQSEVDALTSQGINKIIVLSHQWGSIDTDLKVAQTVKGVDIIVGGGQNHFQYTGCAPDVEPILDEYPIVITPDHDPDGTVLIVHGTVYAKYLGRLNVVFDCDGNVTEWYGNPILLDDSVEQDPETLSEIEEYRKGITAVTDKVVGRSLVYLQGSPRGVLTCRQKECNLGNLITDAAVWYWVTVFNDKEWNDISMAVTNGGGLRDSIDKGAILYREITSVFPFANTYDALQLEGRYVREMLEHSVANYPTSGAFLQVSGIRVTYDISKDPYNGRVVEVLVLCTECRIPEYFPLDDERLYRIAIPSFIASGGDGFGVLRDHARTRAQGGVDAEILAAYIESFTPIFVGLEGRIKFVDS
ncbi:snake venom 5'-nucleotidase-like isoform X2 [Amphiura filiformis]